MKSTILFDIDGTLANIKHRRYFLDGEKPNWPAFNSQMGEDTPNIPIVELFKTLWETHKYEMILISGRSETHRTITEHWLIWNEIPFDKLLMRPSHDFRPDVEIKHEILLKLREQGKSVLLAVDDRNSVVDMWRRNNVTCLQCTEGDF